MLAASPRASCSPRVARFSAPPRSPRAAGKQPAVKKNHRAAGGGGRSGESQRKKGGMSRAEQLRQWKLKRAAAALHESSSTSSSSSCRAATSKRRRGNAVAAVAKASKRVGRSGSVRQPSKIKVSVRRNQPRGAARDNAGGPAMMIDLQGLKSASPDAAGFTSSSSAAASSSSMSSSSLPSKSKKSVASPGLRAMRKRLQSSAKKQQARIRSGVSSETMSLKQRLSAKKKKKKKEVDSLRENAVPSEQNVSQQKRKRKGKRIASRYALPASRPAREPAKANAKVKRAAASNKRRRVTKTSKSSSSSSASGATRAARAIESDIPAQRQREHRNRVRIMAMGDIDIVQNHLKWGRHDAAAAMLQAMSPETEAVAKSLAKYWIQRAHIEEHGGNHAQVQAIFKMAGEHVQGTAQAAEIETEASRYQKRTARWQKVASAQKDSEQQQLDGDDYEDTVLLDSSMSGEPGSVVDDTSKRLSFTSMQLSPPSASSSSSSSSTFANTALMAEDDNNDDDNDISFVFSGGNDSLDLNEDVQSENEDVNTFSSSSSSSSSSFSASNASFSATSSRRRSLTASGRKKIVRVAKCGGLVLVDAPRPQDSEGIDEDSEDENMLLQSPPRPSSVVRMAAVRVASGSKQRELGSARALTPVRRAVRLAKNDEPVLSTTEMLMQNGYSYMPNPSLCGTHFAPNMPLMASDNEPSESDSDGETNENANDPSPRSDEISSCSGGRNSSSSDTIKSQMISPADLASSGESSREPTPMLPRKFAGSSMPPPPPRAPASSTQLGSAFVFNGVTPVRRSARIQELTPTPLRKEMESMLGF